MREHPILALPKSQMYRDMAALGLYDLAGDTLVKYEMQAYMTGVGIVEEALDLAGGDCLPRPAPRSGSASGRTSWNCPCGPGPPWRSAGPR